MPEYQLLVLNLNSNNLYTEILSNLFLLALTYMSSPCLCQYFELQCYIIIELDNLTTEEVWSLRAFVFNLSNFAFLSANQEYITTYSRQTSIKNLILKHHNQFTLAMNRSLLHRVSDKIVQIVSVRNFVKLRSILIIFCRYIPYNHITSAILSSTHKKLLILMEVWQSPNRNNLWFFLK